ncbi:DUF2971 domain-containing protein [Duganella sp. CT11-25]|uniref:DUF2971 domain-containing protein n=1 Tax=unclassified Duganella TaxID=2636909 RepID=UPI0039AF85B2
MYEAHSSIKTPDEDTTIWRYMSLEKLLSMLCTKKLFLNRADSFLDPWEGVWPKQFVADIGDSWKEDHVTEFIGASQALRQTFFVSCWHESKFESAALWDQYAKSAGFAIKTTVGKLKHAITDEKNFFLGRVQYLDYERDNVGELNMLRLPYMKRKSFQHENEVRLLHWEIPEGESTPRDSHALSVDLSVLIDEVYTSPTLDEWLIPHLQELLVRFDLKSISLNKSNLYAPHVY